MDCIIARRRKQLAVARLEPDVVNVREQLARDEHKLQSLHVLGVARDVGNTEILQMNATNSNEVNDTCNTARQPQRLC